MTTPPDTKERILDAAEQLFAELGIEAVSLRGITSAAGVNLAAVNYHFGNKEGLVHAVFARRFGPVNESRLARLDASGDDPPLESVLEAFARPAFELSAADAGDRGACMRLCGRLQTETSPAVREMVRSQFRCVGERFLAAIHAACPHLDADDLMWRFQFLLGAMGYTMLDVVNLRERTDGRCDNRDVDTATAQWVRFAAAGLRAPRAARVALRGSR